MGGIGGYPGSNLGYFGEVGVPGAPLDPLIYVARAGSAMYGPLLMSADDPTQPREPATLVYLTTQLAAAEVTLRTYTDAEITIVRQYVDAQNVIVLQDAKDYTDAAIAALPPIPPVDLTGYLPLAGGVITGNLQVNGDTNVQNLNAAQNINTNGAFFEQGRMLNTIYLQLTGGWISGNLGVFGDVNVVGNGRYLLNGVPINLGGSQTPWIQPIDAADYPLSSANFLIFAVAGSPSMRISPGSGIECYVQVICPTVRCSGTVETEVVLCHGQVNAGSVSTPTVINGNNFMAIEPSRNNTISLWTTSTERMTIDGDGVVRIACDINTPPPIVGVAGDYTFVMIGGQNNKIGRLDLFGATAGGVGNAWCGIFSFTNATPVGTTQRQIAAIGAVQVGGGVNNSGQLAFWLNTGTSLNEIVRIVPQKQMIVFGDVDVRDGGRYLINGAPMLAFDFAAAIEDLQTRVGRLESA